MDSPFVPSLPRKSQENERERERERGLFIERGRKPECAADKELAKRDREGERGREEEFLIRAKWGGRTVGVGEGDVFLGAVLLG